MKWFKTPQRFCVQKNNKLGEKEIFEEFEKKDKKFKERNEKYKKKEENF